MFNQFTPQLRKSLKKEGSKVREEEKAIEIKKKEVRAKAEVEYNKWVKQYKAKKKLQEDAVCFVCYLC